MNPHQEHLDATKFLQDYQSYLDDHHLMNDTITGIPCEEARNLLRYLRKQCPYNLAKAMAVHHPLTVDRWGEIEGRIQDMLPAD